MELVVWRRAVESEECGVERDRLGSGEEEGMEWKVWISEG
jgi:hypothetical protein